jgi:hypothetical protein
MQVAGCRKGIAIASAPASAPDIREFRKIPSDLEGDIEQVGTICLIARLTGDI